ncbi:hypothetical protein P5G51_015605 [Virgibacillus sp. 179-BFC.A HS]|uniref:Uncharacterized protein n=1 Tax=Tigheibacillus jepli TaxID=3035914 RepID=A0ABU5CMA4_9BACI|nr:hypothetical protein [Virgibacillus sp. 179-BFC.A HS]MDY0406598.1 hypothetical protein [Virgibacillus sp. 179-BFC.A HS]
MKVVRDKDLNSKEKIKLNKEYITKKDMFYWIIFLTLIVILSFVWKVSDDSTLVNQFSLVGSVSSILLALIAIGYAFFQANDAGNENKLMLQTLNNIRNEVEQLKDVNDSLKQVENEFFSFKRSTETNNEKIIESLENLKDSINIDPIFNIIEEKYGNIDEITRKQIRESYNKEFEEKLMDLKKNSFKINSEVQAALVSYLDAFVGVGELIDEKDLIEYINKKTGSDLSSYDCFVELEKLYKTGIIEFVKKEYGNDDKLYAIKGKDIRKANESESAILNTTEV